MRFYLTTGKSDTLSVRNDHLTGLNTFTEHKGDQMAFQDIYTQTAAELTALRSTMNVACKAAIPALAQALFAECPTVEAVLWQQSIGTGGISLGTIFYSTTGGPGINPAIKTNGLTSLPHADAGPTQVVEFAAFLQTILYHLYCVYGENMVIVSRAGIIAV
jgi:hypothetical protein